jgi:CDP-diacylglycerol--serine O-phosphatidyltransferase
VRESRRTRGARRRARRARRGERRVVYLLPNLITTAALLLGFWSIVCSSQGLFSRAALLIVFAGICDMLDGRVARATGTSSRFGSEYDSLSDVVSFGLAPALLFYNWMLVPLGPRGWLIASLFAICAALRLARFNAGEQSSSNDYQGLPSTIAGGVVAVLVWFVEWLGFSPPFGALSGALLTLAFWALALLMVSSVPYLSLKGVRIPRSMAYPALVAVVLGLVVLLLYHEPVMFAIGVSYVLSGPLRLFLKLRAEGASTAVDAARPTPEEPPEESPRDV